MIGNIPQNSLNTTRDLNTTSGGDSLGSTDAGPGLFAAGSDPETSIICHIPQENLNTIRDSNTNSECGSLCSNEAGPGGSAAGSDQNKSIYFTTVDIIEGSSATSQS